MRCSDEAESYESDYGYQFTTFITQIGIHTARSVPIKSIPSWLKKSSKSPNYLLLQQALTRPKEARSSKFHPDWYQPLLMLLLLPPFFQEQLPSYIKHQTICCSGNSGGYIYIHKPKNHLYLGFLLQQVLLTSKHISTTHNRNSRVSLVADTFSSF